MMRQTWKEEGACLLALLCFAVSLLLPVGQDVLGNSVGWLAEPGLLLGLGIAALAAVGQAALALRGLAVGLILLAVCIVGAWVPLSAISRQFAVLGAEAPVGLQGLGVWVFVLGLGFLVWRTLGLLSEAAGKGNSKGFAALLVPGLFGA